MSKWSEIYREQLNKFNSLDDFISSRIIYKGKLIDVIKKYSNNDKRILEAGCGSGVTSVFLEKLGYEVVGIDSDTDMISLAKFIAEQQNSQVVFREGDIKNLKAVKNEHFDVIFSNGVMEHFSDLDIISIVNVHLYFSKYVVISVPSDYFTDEQRMYGDERFMSENQWRSLLIKTKGSIIEEFSFNPDPIKIIADKPQFIGFVISSL